MIININTGLSSGDTPAMSRILAKLSDTYM